MGRINRSPFHPIAPAEARSKDLALQVASSLDAGAGSLSCNSPASAAKAATPVIDRQIRSILPKHPILSQIGDSESAR